MSLSVVVSNIAWQYYFYYLRIEIFFFILHCILLYYIINEFCPLYYTLRRLSSSRSAHTPEVNLLTPRRRSFSRPYCWSDRRIWKKTLRFYNNSNNNIMILNFMPGNCLTRSRRTTIYYVQYKMPTAIFPVSILNARVYVK